MIPVPRLLFVLLSLTLADVTLAQTVRTVAGTPGVAGLADGPATAARFNKPTWLDVDRATNAIYVVDRANATIRKIANGAVETRTPHEGWGGNPSAPAVSLDFGGPFGGGIAIEPVTAGCGASIYQYGMFVSRTGSNSIVQLTDPLGRELLLANRDQSGIVPATFQGPSGIALSYGYTGRSYSDEVYVANTAANTVTRIRFQLSFEGCMQPRVFDVIASGFNAPRGVVAAPDGSVYVADSGNGAIKRIDAAGFVTTVVTGLSTPSGIDLDAAGNLYIAETGNHVIRRLSPDGVLTTIAGVEGVAGFADGPALAARFNGPVGIKVVGRTLFIADASNHVVRALDLDGTLRRRSVGH